MSSSAARTDNYCYRHPDRQSFILCQRCLRTICPQCQVQAPVGVHCVECAKANRPAKKRRTGITGGTLSTSAPVVTYSLIGVTVAVFLLQLLTGGAVTEALAFMPAYAAPSGTFGNVDFEPWRLLTAGFVHSTGFFLHVLLNMYTLWIFGTALERMIGHARFLALYLISAVGGSIAVMYLSEYNVMVVGASGAIFGVMAAFVVIHRKLGNQMTQLIVLLGINLVIGFVPGFSISWQAHLGGLITGAILGLILVSTRQRSQQVLQWALVAVVAVLVVGAGVYPALTGTSDFLNI